MLFEALDLHDEGLLGQRRGWERQILMRGLPQFLMVLTRKPKGNPPWRGSQKKSWVGPALSSCLKKETTRRKPFGHVGGPNP